MKHIEKSKLIEMGLATICVVATISIAMLSTFEIANSNQQDEIKNMAINEVLEQNEVTNEQDENTTSESLIEEYAIDERTVNNSESSTDKMARVAAFSAYDTQQVAVEESSPVEQISEQEAYKIIESELELMKQKDSENIVKYFGESTEFTADAVADKLTATIISFVSAEYKDADIEVIVHICTLDYDKMNSAYKEIGQKIKENNPEMSENDVGEETKVEVAKGIVNGDYEVHYNIPVIISNNKVVVSEQYKQAITGNWYNGIGTELTEVQCPLSK